MKESYEVRPSQSPWPRVMRGAGQPLFWCSNRAGKDYGRKIEVKKSEEQWCVDFWLNPFVSDVAYEMGWNRYRSFFTNTQPNRLRGRGRCGSQVINQFNRASDDLQGALVGFGSL